MLRRIPPKNMEVPRALPVGLHIEAGASHRVFYVVVNGPMIVLLHSYKKQSQKAPTREIKIAERRMKEVLHES
jgi:phage-related protein